MNPDLPSSSNYTAHLTVGTDSTNRTCESNSQPAEQHDPEPPRHRSHLNNNKTSYEIHPKPNEVSSKHLEETEPFGQDHLDSIQTE